MARCTLKYCKTTGEVLPIDEARRIDGETEQLLKRRNAMAAHGIQSVDLMEPTKHPLTGKHYSSASKFRAETKARGYDEVGTAYENGYNPEKEAEREYKEHTRAVRRELMDRVREGAPINREAVERHRRGIKVGGF